MKKQILIYSPSIYPCKTGGVEIYNNKLISKLRQAIGVNRVAVFTLCHEYIKRNNNSFYIKQRYLGLRRWGLGGISYFISILLKIKPNRIKLLYTSYTSSFSSDSIVLLLLFHFLLKKPYVLHLHGGGMRKWNPYWLHKLLFVNANKIAAVSEPIRLEYEKRSGRKIDLVHPLVPFTLSKWSKKYLKGFYGLESFEIIILYVGSLKPLKAPDILLEAFVNIDLEIINNAKACLVYCGNGILKEELIQKAKSTNKKNSIFFFGEIPNEKIQDFYKLSDVYVISSLFEGTPISLLEAMYNGLICIGSDVNGINSVIENNVNGLLFPKNNIYTLKNIIQEILVHKEKFRYLKKNAVSYIDENFNYEKYISDFVQYLK